MLSGSILIHFFIDEGKLGKPLRAWANILKDHVH